jgi:hypothetical protein
LKKAEVYRFGAPNRAQKRMPSRLPASSLGTVILEGNNANVHR